MVKEYTHKVIKSGKKLEIYSYEEILLKKLDTEKKEISKSEDESSKKSNTKKVKKKDDESYVRRKSDIALIKKKINRLVYANLGKYKHTDKFLTLTFAYEPTRENVLKAFKRFKERFVYEYGNLFEYIAIMERGTENTERLHLHMIVFNLPYIDKKVLAKIWGNGFVDIKKVNEIKNPVNYITKYIYKTLSDNTIPKGCKFYFTSRGLIKPDEIYLNDEEMYEFLENNDLGELQYQVPFESAYVGECVYTNYIKD